MFKNLQYPLTVAVRSASLFQQDPLQESFEITLLNRFYTFQIFERPQTLSNVFSIFTDWNRLWTLQK
jgi:hypothetical protein